MKTDKEFNNILDDCLERMLVKGETIEQCLRRYPRQAAQLKPLLETALTVRGAADVQPRAEFKAKARYQFGSALEEATSRKSRFSFGWLPRWATVVAIVLVLLLAGGGTVAAAAGSMPDSPLYPVKLATEQVQMILTPSQTGKARLCSSFADERVAEIIYMAEKGDAHQVELITKRLDDRLETLVVLVSELEAGEKNGTDAMLTAPSSGEEAAAPVEPVPEEGLWGSRGHGQTNAEADLWATVVDAAANNPAVLRAILDDVPASVRDALLEAIEVSEAGYQKVLEALQ